MCRWSVRARIDNSDTAAVLFPAVKQKLKMGFKKKLESTPFFHQLNSRKLLVVFDLALSERLQIYNQIQHLAISNRTLINAISSPLLRSVDDEGWDDGRTSIYLGLVRSLLSIVNRNLLFHGIDYRCEDRTKVGELRSDTGGI